MSSLLSKGQVHTIGNAEWVCVSVIMVKGGGHGYCAALKECADLGFVVN